MSDSSCCNNTIILGEHDLLKREYILLKKELDRKTQELHEAKRNDQLLESLQNDYQSEIDLLQSKLENQEKFYGEKIQQLEEHNANLKLKYNDMIHSRDQRLSKIEEENACLQDEIEKLKRSNTSASNTAITNKLYDEFNLLREENIKLLEDCGKMKMALEQSHNQNVVFEKTILEVNKEIEELKMYLGSKKEELRDANELIEKLNEEILCLRCEVDKYKNLPLEKFTKGNSLFAEVDDRRVYLQKTIDTMKSQYMAMKQERAKLLRDIHQLKMENRSLFDKWKADEIEKDEDYYTELQSCNDRIKLLEELLEKYKKDLNTKQMAESKDCFDGFEFYSAMLKNKNQQIEELRQELSSRSLTEILLSKALSKSNVEKRKWKFEALKDKNELEMLKLERINEGEPKEYEQIERVSKRMTSEPAERESFVEFPTEAKPSEKSLTISRGHSVPAEVSGLKREIIKKETINRSEQCNSSATDELTHRLTDAASGIVQDASGSEEEKSGIHSQTNISLKNEENKENIQSSIKNTAENVDSTRKVAFSSDTVSPKKAGLRKCKKVFHCKPTSFKEHPWKKI